MGNFVLVMMERELDSILSDYSSSRTSKAQTLKKLEEHYLNPAHCVYYLSSGEAISDGSRADWTSHYQSAWFLVGRARWDDKGRQTR